MIRPHLALRSRIEFAESPWEVSGGSVQRSDSISSTAGCIGLCGPKLASATLSLTSSHKTSSPNVKACLHERFCSDMSVDTVSCYIAMQVSVV